MNCPGGDQKSNTDSTESAHPNYIGNAYIKLTLLVTRLYKVTLLPRTNYCSGNS